METEHAWRVPIADIVANNYNLNLTNPEEEDGLSHRPPGELLKELISTENEILALLSSSSIA